MAAHKQMQMMTVRTHTHTRARGAGVRVCTGMCRGGLQGEHSGFVTLCLQHVCVHACCLYVVLVFVHGSPSRQSCADAHQPPVERADRHVTRGAEKSSSLGCVRLSLSWHGRCGPGG